MNANRTDFFFFWRAAVFEDAGNYCPRQGNSFSLPSKAKLRWKKAVATIKFMRTAQSAAKQKRAKAISHLVPEMKKANERGQKWAGSKADDFVSSSSSDYIGEVFRSYAQGEFIKKDHICNAFAPLAFLASS